MLNFIKNPAERTRFLKFCVVGVIGFVVDFGIMNLLLHFTGNARLSSTISFIAAVISNFIWNRYWTYPDSREKPLMQQLAQFFLINVIGLGIRYLLFSTIDRPIITLAERILPADFFISPSVVGHNITMVIAVFIVMMWNFFANRLWTYNDVK
ncbi:MAG: GtrA family protein [Anaerolineaceae bacterium]|nr:GtrA family protein [Anaerolineaceae bacterium]